MEMKNQGCDNLNYDHIQSPIDRCPH